MTPLEGSEEVSEGARRFRAARSPAAPQEPRRLGLLRPELGCEARDLSQRHLPLKGLLDVAAAQRRLPRMDALQDERLGEIPAVGELEQPRPEVVVLALEKGRVVTKAVVVEQLAVDEHGRMEERGAEEGEQPNRSGPERVAVQRPGPSRAVEIEDAAAEHGDGRSRADPPDLRLQSPRQRDVVRVEPRDVAPGRLVEATVERRRKPQLLIVA